jgi:valyl-tRNA synthetase
MKKNGRIKNFHEKDLDKPSASIVISGELFKLYFDEDVDLNMIKSTLEKKITKINEEMKKIDTRLSNKSFVDRAPQNIVEQEKSNFANLKKDVKKIELTLKGL